MKRRYRKRKVVCVEVKKQGYLDWILVSVLFICFAYWFGSVGYKVWVEDIEAGRILREAEEYRRFLNNEYNLFYSMDRGYHGKDSAQQVSR